MFFFSFFLVLILALMMYEKWIVIWRMHWIMVSSIQRLLYVYPKYDTRVHIDTMGCMISGSSFSKTGLTRTPIIQCGIRT